MKSALVFTLFAFLIAPAVINGQELLATPPPPPSSSSPTMEQTVDFLSGLLRKQDIFDVQYFAGGPIRKFSMQQVSLLAPCTLEVLNRSKFSDKDDVPSTERYKLDLAKSDPKSLHVSPNQVNLPTYEIVVDRASYQRVPLESAKTASAPPAREVNGLVSEISGNQIVIASSDDNLLYTFVITKKTWITKDEQGISLSEVRLGDEVKAVPQDTKKGQTETKFLIVSTNNQNTANPHTFVPFIFIDPDVAQRAAKALIHAIVLCHKDEGPSLF